MTPQELKNRACRVATGRGNSGRTVSADPGGKAETDRGREDQEREAAAGDHGRREAV